MSSVLPAVSLRKCPFADASKAGVNYWSYIGLDSLLALAQPRSGCADERVFIVFHQITELLFSLVIHELEQMLAPSVSCTSTWKVKLQRVVLYYRLIARVTASLAQSMDRTQFAKFRGELASASAFQSFQYRKIELLSGCLCDLVAGEQRAALACEDRPEILFEHLYWRRAIGPGRPASERQTLADFETRYLEDLREIAIAQRGRTLAERYRALSPQDRTDPELAGWLRRFDRLANEIWPRVHYRLARAYLGAETLGTGGTDWRAYLSGSRTAVRYFPELT